MAGRDDERPDAADASDSELIDRRLAGMNDWRGAALARLRDLIREALPDVVEEVKWRKPSNPHGVPVWSQAGMIATGEIYKDKVKLTFAHGAALDDPAGLFNAGFGGGTRRAIDLREGEKVDPAAFVALVRQAAAFNAEKKAKPKKA